MDNINYYIQNKALLSVEIEDELVMISEDQNNFISLNRTGKVIFDGLSSPKSIDDILTLVLSQFEIDKKNASSDIQLFIAHLIEHRVLLRC